MLRTDCTANRELLHAKQCRYGTRDVATIDAGESEVNCWHRGRKSSDRMIPIASVEANPTALQSASTVQNSSFRDRRRHKRDDENFQ